MQSPLTAQKQNTKFKSKGSWGLNSSSSDNTKRLFDKKRPGGQSFFLLCNFDAKKSRAAHAEQRKKCSCDLKTFGNVLKEEKMKKADLNYGTIHRLSYAFFFPFSDLISLFGYGTVIHSNKRLRKMLHKVIAQQLRNIPSKIFPNEIRFVFQDASMRLINFNE